MNVDVRALSAQDKTEALGVIARGMRDNPIHVAAFGADQGRRARAVALMNDPSLARQLVNGVVLGAFNDDILVGVAGMIPPEGQTPLIDKLGNLPHVFRAGGAAGLVRVMIWMAGWSSCAPSAPHYHVGPVAVAPELQGRGFGSLLMREMCRRMDEAPCIAYLETDRSRNLPFYERVGFQVVGTKRILGVTNWLMTRPCYRFAAPDLRRGAEAR